MAAFLLCLWSNLTWNEKERGKGLSWGSPSKNMKKRFIAFFSVMMLIGCSAVGCSGKDTVSKNQEQKAEKVQSGKEEVHLKIWAGEEDKEYIAVVTQNFIKEHEKEAKITIDWSPMIEGQCRPEMLGDILNAPDVYTTTDGDIQAIVAGGAADPVVNPDEIKKNNMEASVDAVTVNNTIYGYPITADNGYFLYYNKKYFSESDIKSLDKMLDIAAKKKKKFAMDWTSGWYLYSFYGQTGLKVGLNKDGVTNFCDWNSKKNDIKGIDVAEALLKIGRNPGFMNTTEWIDGIRKGKVIACVSGVWDESAIKDMMGKDYGAAILPSYTCAGKQVQMSCFFGYKMIGVNPYSEYKEWAHKLANYISGEENQKLRFQMRGQGPSNINAAQSPEIEQAQAVQAVLAQSEYSQLQRLGGNYWTPTTEFGTTMASGKAQKDLQGMLDRMVKRITASTIQ